MRIQVILFLMFSFLTFNSKANENVKISTEEFQIIIQLQDSNIITGFDSIVPRKVKFKRGKAIIFTLLTGIFGGHRIYFGTHHRTPIIYAITFGGLGILPLIDLIHIVFTKDLSRYEHKSQIIMWGK
ncbi:MAG: hypothetical protein COA97_09255 [Flavobacteriales bacterium]|nr:MAG: hypothetical protein COA97_09255 [Flavobacteriales bacterium]